MTFTKEEIRVLKEMAQDRLYHEEIFLTDENGKRYPSGGYSGWAKAMRGDSS